MDRSKSKMINYGIVYGLSDYGLADRLNIPREEAKTFIDAYLERFSRVAAFMARRSSRPRSEGYVTTLFGRRRKIPELRARNYQVRTLGERLAVNTVIQGTAADVMKLAMIGAHRALADEGLQTRLILTIHDELLFEGPPEETDASPQLAEREMVAPWGDRDPPLAVDAGVGHDLAGGQVDGPRDARWSSSSPPGGRDRRCRRRSTGARAARRRPSGRDRLLRSSGRVVLLAIVASPGAVRRDRRRRRRAVVGYLPGGAARRRATSPPRSRRRARSAPAA